MFGGVRALAEGGDQRGNHFVEIPDDADIRDGEDRRLGILIDGQHLLRAGDACQMLDGAGDSDGDIQPGGDRLPDWPT